MDPDAGAELFSYPPAGPVRKKRGMGKAEAYASLAAGFSDRPVRYAARSGKAPPDQAASGHAPQHSAFSRIPAFSKPSRRTDKEVLSPLNPSSKKTLLPSAPSAFWISEGTCPDRTYPPYPADSVPIAS